MMFSVGDGVERWLFMLRGVVMSATSLAGNQAKQFKSPLTMSNSVSHSVKLGGQLPAVPSLLFQLDELNAAT